MLHLNQPVFSVPRIRRDIARGFFDRELIAIVVVCVRCDAAHVFCGQHPITVVVRKRRHIAADRIRLSQPVAGRRIRHQSGPAGRQGIGQQSIPAIDAEQAPLIHRQTVPVQSGGGRPVGIIGQLTCAVVVPVRDLRSIVPEAGAMTDAVKLIVDVRQC